MRYFFDQDWLDRIPALTEPITRRKKLLRSFSFANRRRMCHAERRRMLECRPVCLRQRAVSSDWNCIRYEHAIDPGQQLEIRDNDQGVSSFCCVSPLLRVIPQSCAVMMVHDRNMLSCRKP